MRLVYPYIEREMQKGLFNAIDVRTHVNYKSTMSNPVRVCGCVRVRVGGWVFGWKEGGAVANQRPSYKKDRYSPSHTHRHRHNAKERTFY